MASRVRCRYCPNVFTCQTEAVRHVASVHPHKSVSILVINNDNKLTPRTYKIKGCEINPSEIIVDVASGKIQVQTSVSDESPVHKMKKINTPSKSVHRKVFMATEPNALLRGTFDDDEDNGCFDLDFNDTNFCSDTSDVGDLTSQEKSQRYVDDVECSKVNLEMVEIGESNEIVQVTSEPDLLKPAVEKMQQLLPLVTAHFEEKGRLQEWTSFFTHVANGNFYVDHIASQLFWDVVKFNTVDNIHGMRFSPEVRQFWSTGLLLFHAKFIRFMGGIKGRGLLTSGRNRAELNARDTTVNFVCPKIEILKEDIKQCNIDCTNPGIIRSNINAIAKHFGSGLKSYKLCIDGKKITAGYGKRLGEVDLFEHESEPTLVEKRERFEVEKVLINKTLSMIDKWEILQKESIDNVSLSEKTKLKNNVINIISVLTERLKELRLLKVKRCRALEKFMVLAGDQWLKSKYSYVISSIKTELLRTNICIDKVLLLNDQLGLIAAYCNGTDNVYSFGNSVNLNRQTNFVCLKEFKSHGVSTNGVPCELIKQRTDLWFKIRKSA